MEATDESVSNSSAENITPLTNGNAHTEAGDEELEGVSNTDNEDEKTSSPKAEIAERAVDSEGWEDLLGSGRLRKRVIKEGDPEHHPAKGHQVKIRFKGTFQGEVFEDCQLEFCVQESEVIYSLDLVLPLMNLGEQCEILSDPEFAYGKFGLPPMVPPNAAIHAIVDLLEVNPAPVATELSHVDRVAIGTRKKDRGNNFYARGEFSMAVQCYRRAVEYFDDEQLELEAPIDRFSLEPKLQDLLQERVKTFNNLAMAQMKLESWEAALSSLRNVLKIEPNNEKALFRKAKCLEDRGQTEEAIGILRRVSRLYPENKQAKADLARLSERRKKNRIAEERMSKRMLGLTEDSKSKKGPVKTASGLLTNSQWLKIGLLMGGAGIVLGGVFSWLKIQM